MRVNNPIQGNVAPGTAKPETSQARKAEQARNAESSGRAPRITTEKNDVGDASTEISSRAKEMAQAKAAAMDAPETRDAKIAELKRRIANKEYNVKPEDIADRMVDDHIRTHGLG